MNEERLKVLKMLKEGRITMEEAEVLLDALGEGGEQRSRDEEATMRNEEAGTHSHGDSSKDQWTAAAERFFSGLRGGNPFNLDLKLDPQFFQTGFRDAMKGFEQSMKQFAGELGKMDFPGGFKEFFGRSSGQATKSLLASPTGAARVSISNRWGDIRINATEADEISGTASITAWGSDPEKAEEIAKAVEVSHFREEDTIALRCELPADHSRTRYRVDLDLNLPSGLALTVKGMSGDVSVSGMTAGVSVVNLSGDIIVQHSSGIIGLESKSGDIEVLDCNGEVRAHSLSGELNLEHVRPVLVQAHTISGDIHADIEPVGQSEIELQTTSGDIVLSVPEDTGLDLKADTTSGEITCQLPAELSVESANHIEGSVGGGGTTVRTQTKSGDITLRSS